ncbi:hypothetical protein M8494_27405 [Serratia ureilytica]
MKPEGYDELFEYASRLSAPFEFVRVDFYISKGQIIFGELTFTPPPGWIRISCRQPMFCLARC